MKTKSILNRLASIFGYVIIKEKELLETNTRLEKLESERIIIFEKPDSEEKHIIVSKYFFEKKIERIFALWKCKYAQHTNWNRIIIK